MQIYTCLRPDRNQPWTQYQNQANMFNKLIPDDHHWNLPSASWCAIESWVGNYHTTCWSCWDVQVTIEAWLLIRYLSRRAASTSAGGFDWWIKFEDFKLKKYNNPKYSNRFFNFFLSNYFLWIIFWGGIFQHFYK